MKPVMKNITYYLLISLVFVLGGQNAEAQKTTQKKSQSKPKQEKQILDRSIRPLPGSAPEIQIAKYESFTLDNGLKVFVVENHKIPRVTYSLLVDYVPVPEGELAGLSDITGQLLRSGTKNMNKDQLDEEIDFIGAELSTTRNGLYASGLSKHNDKLLQLMADILFNPAFDSTELQKIKVRTISGLEAEKNDPAAISDRISKKVIYGENHPYGESMSMKSVNAISDAQCRMFFNTFFQPQISYMAIVGDISFAEAKAGMENYFSKWNQGQVVNMLPPAPKQPDRNTVVIVDRPEAVQTTLSLGYPVDLKPGTPEAIKASVSNTILGGGTFRLFNNLREKHGYTYGAYSRLTADKYAGIFNATTEIRNSVTDSAINEILYEMKRMHEEPIPQDELSLVKNYLSGNFALSLERPQTVANFAINIARYNLPQDYYANYLKNLALVTAEDVKAISEKYIMPNNNYIIAVGRASDIVPKLLPFTGGKQIRYFDVEGKEYDPNKKVKDAPAGMTAEDVNKAYITAIGGEKALSKVKDITMNASTNMQGMVIGFDVYRKAPNKYMMKVGAGDMIFQQITFNGTEGQLFSPMGGETKKLEGSELEDLKLEATLNPELKYSELGVKLKLEGIETINETEAYKVVLTYPSGKESTRYFDTKTNYLIKEISEAGTIELSDYRSVNNLMFPFKIKQSMGPQIIDLNVLTMKVNSKLGDELFQLK